MATIAVIGATGTAGSRVVDRLRGGDDTIVEISRSHGVDLITGQGLSEALRGADVVVDASNAYPPDEALTTATRNVVAACATEEVSRLVLLTMAGVGNAVFDDFPYYAAKREQEAIVRHSGLPTTIVKSTQWYEFATNPVAVTFTDREVIVQDWFIQPIAADTVADVLAVAALGSQRRPRTITGPDPIHLPELTSKMLHRQGDRRRVRVEEPPLPALTDGSLLASGDASVIGPDVDTWLETSASVSASRIRSL